MAATSETMELVEVFQVQNSEGPCFDCYRLGEAVQVDDLASARGRWPGLVRSPPARAFARPTPCRCAFAAGSSGR